MGVVPRALGVFLLGLATLAAQDAFDDLARRAEAALDSKPADAAALYRQALALRPNWAEGWFNLGGALYQIDRYAESTDALRKAVELAPGHGIAWGLLGLSEAELDNPEQALADIRKAEDLGLGPDLNFERAVRVKAARLLVSSSTFDEAMAQLRPLSKKGDTSAAVIDTMGMCALAQPGKLSELTPERRAVVSLVGQAAWASVSQRPAEAESGYKQLLEKYPNEPGVHYAYSLFLMETDLGAALAEVSKDIGIEPRWPALILGASFQMRQGAPDKALEWLGQSMKTVPTRYRWLCHAEMGRVYMSADNYEAAIRELQSAVRLRPTVAQVHFMLAQALRLSGKPEDAKRETAEFQRLKAQQDPLALPALQSVYSKK